MRYDKENAFELRHLGKSYKEIADALGMSMATLSDWFKNEPWSQEIKSKLSSAASAKNIEKLTRMQSARKKQLEAYYSQARIEAEQEYSKFRTLPLFIAGLMIYWGEGNKLTKGRCIVANTEPAVIRVFCKFLTEVCRIEAANIRAWILLYPDLSDEVCKKYWMSSAGLTEGQFLKSVIIQGKSKVRRLHYGVCNVGFHNRYFKEKVLTWLRLVAEDLTATNRAGIV